MNNLWCTNYSSVRTNTRFTVLNLEFQGYSNFKRSVNLFHISLKLKSDEAIEVAVKCNCNVINYIWQSNCM